MFNGFDLTRLHISVRLGNMIILSREDKFLSSSLHILAKIFNSLIICRVTEICSCFLNLNYQMVIILLCFLLQTSSKTISKLAHPNAPLGYGMCFLNLAFDGFTNATQDSIKAK